MLDPAPKAIFLSYARDDAAAARRIAEALRSSDVEVWFDENELRGGDAWDANIRKQIDACALFIAVISQNTESRTKGYFRLEWNLAVAQTQMLAEGVPFIAPVVIDETKESGASVPAEFLRVQWTRLPGALPTPQFVEQVKRLLATPSKPAAPSRSSSHHEANPPKVDRTLRARFGWVAAGAGALAVAAIIVYFNRPSSEPAARRSAPPTSAAGPLSEARQLVAKARALYEPWDLASRDDFILAEQLLKKATDLDPADGDAWAAFAILSCGFSVSGRDIGVDRTSVARIQAERAVKLAPDLNAARFARAFSLRFNPQTRDECLRLLRDEVARQPGNRMVVRILGTTLNSFGQAEQSLLYLDRAAALPGRDPVTLYNRGQVLEQLGRFVEAEAAADEVLALAPHYPDANAMKLRLLLDYHGNLAAAREHLGKIPPAFLTTDSGAVIAGIVWLYSREPEKCLESLRPAQDFISQNNSGLVRSIPKAYLTGLAQRMAGNVDAARSDWRAALQVIEQRLATQPNAGPLLLNKTVLLALLGEHTEVEPLLREIRQRAATESEGNGRFNVARVLVMMGRQDEAMVALNSLAGEGNVGSTARNSLRYHPEWDALRGNPQFEALLKGPERKK